MNSKELLERAEAEHRECVTRWQRILARWPKAQPIYHGLEYHIPQATGGRHVHPRL